jgi:hypothetical protein
MLRFKYRAHLGPTIVQETTNRMRFNGVLGAQAGTEHVYGQESASSKLECLDLLNAAAGFTAVHWSEIWEA